jgi:NAD(P)-dependent dehydrogenase (short-subunit alcohol dehydrogenase family)
MNKALICGAAGEIGSALADQLNEDGWLTLAVARDSEAIPSGADRTYEADFQKPASVEQAVYTISQDADGIDLMCYAAGDILSSKVADLQPDDWDRVISANLSGAYLAVHYSLPLLSQGAHIFLIGAVSERLRLPGLSAYAAAKAGLEAFAQALAKEQRSKRITVVRPGAVATSFWEKVPLRMPADAPPPAKVARKILEAYHSGHKGQLDLV